MIERDLRTALRNHELEVWFQPRFEARTLRISGYEALARWRHPERGFISPTQFIPVAEQCGLIGELGIGVLEDACAFAASLPDGRIAVNLSPVQFLSDNLPSVIGGVLLKHDLLPDRLELEITEGVLIADEMLALSTLRNLHDRGFQLALDDFGTGYASLSYLRRFPFDRIKIDRSFVQAQEHDHATRAIVESVLTMAKRLRLEVTAEGVETERQLSLLCSQECPEIQGYLLGRPMTAADARVFHASHDAAAVVCELSAA
jgi:EAL domain-containing protein (putative c-di-GMP-specific phosphodiesterase class I)